MSFSSDTLRNAPIKGALSETMIRRNINQQILSLLTSTCLSIYPYFCLSVYLSLCKHLFIYHSLLSFTPLSSSYCTPLLFPTESIYLYEYDFFPMPLLIYLITSPIQKCAWLFAGAYHPMSSDDGYNNAIY